ncbi:uncharacterized protein LOC116426560 [Nomia melanderi]|uniref:uncharacterized protein LOC116426560 n=1 Tax=Nomia melanderi TaxID=2448451 RepID=UPI003FCD0058
MNRVLEERRNYMQSENALTQDTKKEMVHIDGKLKLNNDESKSLIADLFPWMLEFRKMCRCIHAEKSMTSLTKLMEFYARNVSISVNECYTRPLRAAKLKDSISETLLLFMYIYREVSEDCNRSIYLNNMSDLLALYIDMELKASRKSKEEHEKISARLTSCLYVYLEHSTQYLLDTLMKIQFMCRNYHHILDPIITKIMKNIPMHPESSTMYLRYFLVYRLWRKINEDVAVRNRITAAAIVSLGPVPSTFSPCTLEDVLPKVPKSQSNSTKTLLQHKFDIKRHCELFVQYCKEKEGGICQKDGPATSIDSSSRVNSQTPEDSACKDTEYIESNVNSIIVDKNKHNESISLLKTFKSINLEEQSSFKCLETFSNNISTKLTIPKTIKLNKNRLRRNCKKSNEIVIIDLTSDTVFEKCIKRRKSRKLPWLEEAKKRIDLKIAKASHKTRDQKKSKEENIDDTHSSNSSRPVNRQLEDISQLIHTSEDASLRHNLSTCWTVDTKNTESKLEIENKLIDYTENVKKSTHIEIDSKKTNVQTSCPMPLLQNESNFSTQKTLNSTVNDNYMNDCIISKTESNEKENDRNNEQTVIKRLMETNIFSEPDTHERAESFKIVCDLGTECPSVNSTAICTRYNPKDNAVNSNCSNLNINNDRVTERVISSIIMAETASKNKTAIEQTCTPNFFYNTINSEGQSEELFAPQETDKREMICTEVIEDVSKNFLAEGFLQDNEQQESLPASTQNSSIQGKFELQTEIKSPKCTNEVGYMKKEEFCEQTALEICDYNEVKCIREDKTSVVNIRESIFGSYSTDKKDISNKVNITCPNTSFSESIKSVTNDKYDHSLDKTDVPSDSDLSLEITPKKESNKLYRKVEDKQMCGTVQNEYVVQDPNLQDNIDGLSLLASVSQHIPHLKPETEMKCDQIKVKDYASLRYTCCSQITNDETENDSSNLVSQLLENPSTEIINRIVGVYPEDSLNKVAFHVEVTSNDTETENANRGLYNNLAPVENNIQTTKENTNVILNGETVVLLQKSPNSNLYIINKAVENSKDHNDEDISRLKDKNWISSTEECGSFEAITSVDHVSYNLELTAYNKELQYQESKCSMGRGIKVELEENSFSDSKLYTKKVATDMISVNSSMYQDVNITSKSLDKLKSSKSSLSLRQNIKQELSISNHCAISGCNSIHSHPHEVDSSQLHIPVTHPTTLPPIYGNCASSADLCVSCHNHCSSVSCGLQINTNSSLHSHAKSSSPCGRSHCSCLNCTYDIVTRYRQCIHPATDTHVSCIESSSYFLPTHSSVQNSTVQEHDRTKSEVVMNKLYDDQLFCKIEKSLPQSSQLDKLEVQRDPEKVFKKDSDNMLPLKKRLKAHAMAYTEMAIKAEKVDNYPAVPMMSIAALEALDNTQKRSVQMVKSEYELSPGKKDHHDGYCNSNLVRRDYYKDLHVSGTHQNHAKESMRKLERQFRSTNDQSNAVYQETCLQRSFKTPAQRKEINILNGMPLKRMSTQSIEQEEETLKKIKKTQSPLRQTRSSKRNVPKVNYSYTDVDPEWNPSG